jgi:hypothetical protein
MRLTAAAAAAAAGDWNGAGGHVNYSNNATRAEGTGWDAIQAQIAKLEKRHAYHIAQYGEVSQNVENVTLHLPAYIHTYHGCCMKGLLLLHDIAQYGEVS